MTTMNISLSESLKEYVQERVAEGDYSNASDYVRALVREDKKRQAERKLEALLLEGLESGEPKEMTPEDWEDIRNTFRARLSKNNGHGQKDN